MNGVAGYIVESTLTAIVLAWVLTHSTQFSQILAASNQATVGAVHALWAN